MLIVSAVDEEAGYCCMRTKMVGTDIGLSKFRQRQVLDFLHLCRLRIGLRLLWCEKQQFSCVILRSRHSGRLFDLRKSY